MMKCIRFVDLYPLICYQPLRPELDSQEIKSRMSLRDGAGLFKSLVLVTGKNAGMEIFPALCTGLDSILNKSMIRLFIALILTDELIGYLLLNWRECYFSIQQKWSELLCIREIPGN